MHAHSTRAVWDVVNSATGSRRNALKWIITTAGFNRAGVCYEQHDYVCKLLERTIQDEHYFGIIYTIDEGDDWVAESSWRKANPNYGVSVLPEDIATLCHQAQLSAQSQNDFLTKRLNVWVSADTAFFNMRGIGPVPHGSEARRFRGPALHHGPRPGCEIRPCSKDAAVRARAGESHGNDRAALLSVREILSARR